MSQAGGGREEGAWAGREGGAEAGREGWAPLSRALSPLHSSEGGRDRDFPGQRYGRGPLLYLKEGNTSISLIYFLQLLQPVSISHCECLVRHPSKLIKVYTYRKSRLLQYLADLYIYIYISNPILLNKLDGVGPVDNRPSTD